MNEADTKIIEMMPDGVSDEIAAAIAEGRLCRYAVELEGEIERLKTLIAKGETNARINQQSLLNSKLGLESQLTAANAEIERLKEKQQAYSRTLRCKAKILNTGLVRCSRNCQHDNARSSS